MNQSTELAQDFRRPINHDRVYSFEATCDPHVHIDEWDGHGISPVDLAHALHERANSRSGRLNVAVLLAHNAVDADNFFRVEQILADISEGTRRRVKLLFGTELTVWHAHDKHHIVCVFDGEPNPFNYPEIPRSKEVLEVKDFEGFMKDPFVSIAAHPGMMDKEVRRSPESTLDILGSGLINGIEVGNGNILTHSPRFDSTGATDIATSLAFLSHLAVIGGSDAHEASEVGNVVTKFRRDVDAVGLGFLDAVKGRRTHPIFVGDKVRALVHGPLCKWGILSESFGDNYVSGLSNEERLDYTFDDFDLGNS